MGESRSSSMRAALFQADGSVVVEHVAVPVREPGGVLLRVRACGICGSDLHGLRGAWKPQPHCIGHEIAGEVLDIDAGQGFETGDHVAVEPIVNCGHCLYCETGDYNHCQQMRFIGGGLPGGYAEYLHVPSVRSLHHVPADLPWDQAAMTEPLAVGVHALRLAGIAYGMAVAVVGGGTIGLLALAAAKAMGATRTGLLAKYPHQADAARRLGVDDVALTTNTDATARLAEATGGGYDLVVEAVGATSQAPQQAIELVRRLGTVVLTGVFTGRIDIEASRLVGREIRLAGSNCYAAPGAQRRDFSLAVDLLRRGTVDAGAVITHRFPLAEAPGAFATSLDKRSGVIKAVLTN